jgi:hypothetical protein
MQTDGWSVEQCLDAYPEYREILDPILNIGIEVHRYLSPRSPSSQFARNSSIRIQNRMKHRAKPQRRRSMEKGSTRRRWYLRPAYALAGLVLVFTLLASSIGVVNASAASLPGDALYRVKLARERFALTLSMTDEGDERLLAGFAEERLNEAEALVGQNRLDDVPEALQGFDDTLSELAALTAEDGDMPPGSLEHLQNRLTKHVQVLQALIEDAPEPAREALQKALEKSSHSQEVLERVRGEGSPSENAPGQNKPDAKNGDDDGQPGNSGQDRGPKPKEENGPPPWANNDKDKD